MANKRYDVWRYHKLVFTGNFREVKAWMLANLPVDYQQAVSQAKTSGVGNNHGTFWWNSLQGIAAQSEYCSLREAGK